MSAENAAFAVAHPTGRDEPLIEVTPEMIEAGYDALWDEYDLLQEDVRPEQLKEALKAVYVVMRLVEKS